MSAAQAFPVFVINLERASARREHMAKLVAELGLDVEFVAAVDGAALTDADRAPHDRARARVVYGAELTDPEMGCYLSHYRLWERMVREDMDCALILEDDIDASANLSEIVRQLIDLPWGAWSVVRLQSSKHSIVTPTTAASFGRKVADVAGGGLYRLESNVLGSGGYLIRKSAAEKMVAYGARMSMPLDHTLDRFWENGIVPFVVRPFPIWQIADVPTLIGERGRNSETREPLAAYARRRLARVADSVSKRVFRLALRSPALGRAFALAHVRSAELAIEYLRGVGAP